MRKQYTILHLFCGMGGGGLGASEATARMGRHEASFTTLGGVDLEEVPCRNFEQLVGAKAVRADISKMQPAELIAAVGPDVPDMVLTSPPCRGFSALLPKKLADTEKYQAMNRLVLEGIHLVLSTWPEGPRVIFLENVPRIVSRGAELLDKLRQLLVTHGYAFAEGFHDCGEVGGLAQRRRRYFLVARNRSRMPEFVYVPPKKGVMPCGSVLGTLPIPGISDAGGPMHELSRLSWLNWLRLAAIPAGGDWRDLPGTVPRGKKRRDVHRRHATLDWKKPSPTIGGSGSNGAVAIADPRALALGATAEGSAKYKGSPGLMGVLDWAEPSKAVTGNAQVSGSNMPAAVADPRLIEVGEMFNSSYRVMTWADPANTVTGAGKPSSGGASVADPRLAPAGAFAGSYGVMEWDAPAGTVSSEAYPSTGTFSVSDPRSIALTCEPRSGAYGVLSWEEAARTIGGDHRLDNGRVSIADARVTEALARIPSNPKRPPRGLVIILAADGTWHRPLTTLELLALQGFPTHRAGEPIVLAGSGHGEWRSVIGDAIPPPAARAVAEQILEAMLASDLGTFRLRNEAVWVAERENGAVYV